MMICFNYKPEWVRMDPYAILLLNIEKMPQNLVRLTPKIIIDHREKL